MAATRGLNLLEVTQGVVKQTNNGLGVHQSVGVSADQR